VWIEEGRSPYIFLHTADNRMAAALAQHFHQRLMARLPGLAALPELPRAPGRTTGATLTTLPSSAGG
jgi:uncharacterized protein YecE (DUF72 family)